MEGGSGREWKGVEGGCVKTLAGHEMDLLRPHGH